ncbi:uncharacterized protein LOC133659778 isoform X2 [Entelurus aequoreus]|uniref:uncharacterized protein LOC133659778 isoform X2 n=1 Tax=Entelurus aequoreus TaxID=161455 RepID=UPI002B1DA712|nr:uncharacterized protein LOC133659778 isoform X2 [Entelurus aequoreus]
MRLSGIKTSGPKDPSRNLILLTFASRVLHLPAWTLDCLPRSSTPALHTDTLTPLSDPRTYRLSHGPSALSFLSPNTSRKSIRLQDDGGRGEHSHRLLARVKRPTGGEVHRKGSIKEAAAAAGGGQARNPQTDGAGLPPNSDITWTKIRPSGGKFCGQMKQKWSCLATIPSNMFGGEKEGTSKIQTHFRPIGERHVG